MDHAKEVVEALGPGGPIARRLPGYEPRAPQIAMARGVAEAIADGEHLLVEAGTGVGKSFGYLVPAILQAVAEGSKVVVSTQTISLQEQLLEKDLPFLRSVLPVEFSAVLVKGRSNYISLRRLDAAGRRAQATFQDPDDFDQLARLRRWAGETTDGSLADLGFRPRGAVWDAVASENGNCLGRSCPSYQDCHYFRARRRVRAANLLVVNHALYMSDLAIRRSGAPGILPDHEVVVFDEAHGLEAVASDHLGLRITQAGLDYTLNRLVNERTSKGLLIFHGMIPIVPLVARVRVAASTLFDDLRRWTARVRTRNGRLLEPPRVDETVTEALERLANAIAEAVLEIDEEEQRIELNAQVDRCRMLAGSLRRWLHQDDPDSVYWLETGSADGVSVARRDAVVMASAPLEPGPILREFLFGRVPSCILTSATLSTGSPPSFDFIQGRLGLTQTQTLQLGSPFDFANQVTLHIPTNLPDPSRDSEAFEEAALRAIPHYLELSDGRAFVLFTSYRLMQRAEQVLTPWCIEREITLLRQGDGRSRSRLIALFRDDVRSVLLGVDSFWQGVDIPGEALSNVIIVRLPFSVPNRPLLEARLEQIRQRGGNPFQEFQIPEAIVKLKQGFGRLIRSERDTGHIVLLDPRVIRKPYGRQFLESLPPTQRRIGPLDRVDAMGRSR